LPQKQKLPTKVNDVETSRLVKSAKNFLLTKPDISVENADAVSWAKEEANINYKIDPAWLSNHQPAVKYFSPNQDIGEFFNYLKGKYAVTWFFIPGCEENPNSSNEPNWFDKKGLQCMGGYDLEILINSNLTAEKAVLLQMN
jgi:hypothetical protein